MNKKFFFTFMAIGILMAAANLFVLYNMESTPKSFSLRVYLVFGVMMALVGTGACILHLIDTRMGTGSRHSYIGSDDKRHDWTGNPVPKSAGFAAGFGGFYIFLFVAFLVKTLIR